MKEIHYGAFSNVGLDSIDIPEGVTSIGKSCFVNSGSLKVVTLPATIAKVDDYAFLNVKLENCYAPANVVDVLRSAKSSLSEDFLDSITDSSENCSCDITESTFENN